MILDLIFGVGLGAFIALAPLVGFSWWYRRFSPSNSKKR